MMNTQQVFFHSVILILALFGGIVVATPCIGGSSIILDKESVFCVYYKLSGDVMSDQDIEDLSMARGKPTFSHYKPAELFTKRTVHQSRKELLEKMKRLDETSIFKWNIAYACTGEGGEPGVDFNKILPQPTSLIGAQLSPKGQKVINMRLAQAINALRPGKSTTLTISVYLKPHHIDNRFEDRNIGRQNVFFPLRYVVFHPVKIAVTLEKKVQKLLTSRNTYWRYPRDG